MSKSLDILRELSCDKDNVDKVLAYVHEYLSIEQNEEKWKKQVREEKSNVIKSIEESLGVPKATFLILLKNIKKDQISVCKDCEFRYVCTDCRAYTQNSGDQYSKPLKCNYDPYTATWN